MAVVFDVNSAFDMNQYLAVPVAEASPGNYQQLVVKHTFLEFVPRDRPGELPRACTDSMVYGVLPQAPLPMPMPMKAGGPFALGAHEGLRLKVHGGARQEELQTEERPRASSRGQESPTQALPVNDRRTTVMMRNLPLNYTRAMLLEMLDNEGFRGQYDFVYMPLDFKTMSGLGYAFVNLVDASLVPGFWAAFDGFSRWVLPTSKVCQLGWSKPYQGLRANLQRYRNSSVMHCSVPDECKPILFADGARAPFPRPTRAIQAPCKN